MTSPLLLWGTVTTYNDASHLQVSAKEEKDLQTLLEMFALGVGDVEEFQERLQAELAALEVRPCTVLLSTCSHVLEQGLKLFFTISA